MSFTMPHLRSLKLQPTLSSQSLHIGYLPRALRWLVKRTTTSLGLRGLHLKIYQFVVLHSLSFLSPQMTRHHDHGLSGAL
uniref:Putative ovule protein n=1 Tax=Solanum chacoense TaxID=4108 RepID=A0A0V0I1R9_SOLCH